MRTIFFHHYDSDSLFKDILEDVFKSAIVGFKDGVLCAHVQGPLLANCILEAAVCKACDRLGKKSKESMAAVSFYQQYSRYQPSE